MKEWLKINYCLAVAIIAGAILRFLRLDYQSIWLDEIHTVAEADPRLTFSEVNDMIMMGEQMPPLYFYIIHILFKVFGHSLMVARAFSAVLGVFAIYAIYLLGKQLINRTAGVVAAWLLAFNFFHIYYSQEARPYAFFFLFTTLSIYWFAKFLKKPNWKNSIYYGIFTALMLYGHFFGLLGLLAQGTILFWFLILNRENFKKYMPKATVSFGITAILFSPAIKFLLNTSKISQFWLQKPDKDAFTNIFKTFTGNNEILIVTYSLLIILFVAGQTNMFSLHNKKLKDLKGLEANHIWNKPLFLFILSVMWIGVVITIPLIKSYISTPIILDRYFINLLPVMVIMAAAGLNTFKFNIAKYALLAFVSIVSLVNILFITKYYTSVSKTQFREAASFILDKNKQNYPVVTRLDWHMKYFFQNGEVNYSIIGKPIEEYLSDLKKDTTNIVAFWYIDGHSKPYSFSAEDKHFLDKHYLLEESYDGFNIYSKLFIPVKEAEKSIDITKFGKLKDSNGDKIHFSIEAFSFQNGALHLKGWSFFENTGTESTKTRIVLLNDDEVVNLGVSNAKREDITLYFNNTFDFDNSGFEIERSLKDIKQGRYRIGLYMIDKLKGKEGLVITDKVIINQG